MVDQAEQGGQQGQQQQGLEEFEGRDEPQRPSPYLGCHPALAEGLTLSASYCFGQDACPSWQQAFFSLQHCATSWAGVVAPHSTASTRPAMTASPSYLIRLPSLLVIVPPPIQ